MSERETQYTDVLLGIALFALVLFGIFSINVANFFDISFHDGAVIMFHLVILAVGWFLMRSALPGLHEIAWPLLPALAAAGLVNRLEVLQTLAEAHQMTDTVLWVMRGPAAFFGIALIGYAIRYGREG